MLMETGSETPGRDGNLRVFLGATNCSAGQIFKGNVLARKSAQ